jgi:hypothetical protein
MLQIKNFNIKQYSEKYINPLIGINIGDIEKSLIILEKLFEEPDYFLIEENYLEEINLKLNKDLNKVEGFLKNCSKREIFMDVTINFLPTLKILYKNTLNYNEETLNEILNKIIIINKDILLISR